MISPTIVLASGSPRRRELLAGLGLEFITQPSSTDEVVEEKVAPSRYVELLSERKAHDVATSYGDRDAIVIGSDTVVVLDGEILGKPSNEQDAINTLTRLEGRSHQVFTGLCLVHSRTGQKVVGHSTTDVFMRPMDRDLIERYVRTGEPMDKAGSYGIQGYGATLVREIHGDYFTVVGLPVALLKDYLDQFGIHIL